MELVPDIPINAPKCPMHHFQQDGHMAMTNPVGRVNYEPNSWDVDEYNPRETHERGFTSYPSEEEGTKRRARSETFADHYSQARQFYVSQTPPEQRHIANAFVFELSKCDKLAIRERMVGHLRHVDEDLASTVADGLGMQLTEAPTPAREPITDLPPSPALSIIENGPDTFAGRKVGVLVTDGVNAEVFAALRQACQEEGTSAQVVAPTIAGVRASDGSHIDADEKVDGGPSVVFDAVALLPSTDGAQTLAAEPTAKDFVTDAFAHLKFIAHGDDAAPLLEAAGIADMLDDGCVQLRTTNDATRFVEQCRAVRHWEREPAVDQT